MCTSIVVNRKKTIIGFNLDLSGMEHRISESEDGVYIEAYDEKEGWLPLFGANSRGDFVAMPTCWPSDERSDPENDERNIINLDIDLLLQKKTLQEVKYIAEREKISSVKGLTFMAALSDAQGNVLHIVPGQGSLYYERPDHQVMTNFSPFKMDSEKHPLMGYDRYLLAEKEIEAASADFDVDDCFRILKDCAQQLIPTVVSMVYDVGEHTVYWCENQNFNERHKRTFRKKILETARLYLREMDSNDHEALSRVISDPENMAYYQAPYDHDGVTRWIDWCKDSYRQNGFGLWAICLKENDELIGDCGISMQNIDGELLPEIGFHIRRDQHHKGYAKEAALAVRDWGLKRFPALYSYCTSDNIASYRTAEAIGMRFLKEYTDKDGISHRVSFEERKD